MSESRASIEHSAEGTLAYFAKDELDVRAAVKAAGFRWSRNLGAWFLPRAWAEPTRRARVNQVIAVLGTDAVEVEDQGHAPQTSAAEREQAAQERAAERAERMDSKAEKLSAESDAQWERSRSLGEHIPFGQPILVGHHSERRHRNTLAKIEATGRKSAELSREADAAAASADSARRAAAGASPLARQRRIERKSAELRGVEREIAACERAGTDPDSGWYRQQVALRDRLADEIAHDRAAVEASGVKVFSKADVAKGDVVIVRGRPRKVARVNAKSVSVETGYSWTDTVPYHEITRVVKPEGIAV